MNRLVRAAAIGGWLLGAPAWAGGVACPSIEPPDPGGATMETARVMETKPGEAAERPGGVPAEVATFALG